MPTPAARGIPAASVALNVFAGLWVIGVVASGTQLWPAEDTLSSDVALTKAVAIVAMLVCGVGATVALSVSAVVAQVAKRDQVDAA